jgi:hypothetical protein
VQELAGGMIKFDAMIADLYDIVILYYALGAN